MTANPFSRLHWLTPLMGVLLAACAPLGVNDQHSISIPSKKATGVAIGDGGGDDGRMLVLLSDGTICTSGSHSALGNELTSTTKLTLWPGLSGVRAVITGTRSSYVLLTNGTVMAIGTNDEGQLGLGDTTTRTAFTAIPGLSHIVQISAGGSTFFALASDGTLYVTGWNNYSQTGIDTATAAQFETPQVSLTGVAEISAGYYTAGLVKNDGTVWITGNGISAGWSQLTTNGTTPVSGMAHVASGDNYFVFVDTSGNLWHQGNSPFGSVSYATQLTSVSGVKAVSAGLSNISDMVLVLKTDGTLWFAGNNALQYYDGTNWYMPNGLAGNGDTTTSSFSSLIQVASQVAAMSAGENQWALVKTDNSVWTNGANSAGELGIGSATPYYVTTLTQVVVP